MSSNMRGGWKVNPTEVRRQRSLEAQYMQTAEGQSKNNFGIFVVIFTIVALLLF